MEQLVISAHNNKNWDILTEILHHKIQFLEIQYALGMEDFQDFVSSFQLLSMDQHEGMELMTGKLYFFVSGGCFTKKFQKPKEGRNKRTGIRKGISSNDAKSPRNFTLPIAKGFLTSMQDFLCGQVKVTDNYYSLQPKSAILRLGYQNLQHTLCLKLRNYYSAKVKFLNQLTIFKQIPKNIIQENIQKFKFTKLSFNDLIYSDTLRTKSIFVLMKGEAVIEDEKINKGIIVKPPSILGDEKFSQNQQARCLTQFCVCYSIQRNELESILKKKPGTDQKQLFISPPPTIGLLRAKYFRQFQSSTDKTHRFLDAFNLLRPKPDAVSSFSNLNINRKHSKKMLICLGDNQKKQRIKEHFSNFLSDKFDQYSSKLQKQKNFNENRQTPILYQMKPLCPSSPNYEQIQLRLKRLRIRKILDAKQNIHRSNSSQSLLGPRERNQNSRNSYRIEKDSIDAKIQRTLNYKITKQINRKYGMRARMI